MANKAQLLYLFSPAQAPLPGSLLYSHLQLWSIWCHWQALSVAPACVTPHSQPCPSLPQSLSQEPIHWAGGKAGCPMLAVLALQQRWAHHCLREAWPLEGILHTQEQTAFQKHPNPTAFLTRLPLIIRSGFWNSSFLPLGLHKALTLK